ncbi:PH domain-containing protein [Halosegnis sp.]|uniref:PH domain-containing protein n=1 Tax=Halosegnis sp. TaxID=2864959 RepID=UPI0035D4962C
MKLHPLSVLYRTAASVTRLGWVVVVGAVSSSQFDRFGLAAGGLLGAVLLVAFAYQVAVVRRFDYRATEDTFDISSGVFSRRTREIPYRRVQNVDVSRNVLQRALGIAELRVETAGGGETEVRLRYVGDEEAERLQREIGRRKRDEDNDAATPTGDTERLFAITPTELLLLGLVSVDLRLLSFATVLVPVLVPSVSRQFPLVDLFRAAPALLAGLVLLALVISSLRAVTGYYGFELRRGDGELRYRRGLAQEYSGTIPLDKVQAVVISENVLSRLLGYAALSVETAGYAPGDGGDGSQSAVPIAERARVLALAREVEPFGTIEFERPPRRARTRYAIRYTLAIFLLAGLGVLVARVSPIAVPVPGYAPLVLLPLAPVAAHMKWTHLGFALGENHFIAREGFWTRRTRVLAYYRVQTLVESATVFQRRRDLATVVVDTAGAQGFGASDARALDIDAERANELRRELETRFETALATTRRERAGDAGPNAARGEPTPAGE